jgi:hypothetical protein
MINIRNILKILFPSPGFRDKLKRIIGYTWIIDRSNRLSEACLLASAPRRYRKLLKKLEGKAKIKVVFLLLHESVWKYEGVYRLMEQDERFDPLVVICPYVAYGQATMSKEMHRAFENFSAKGYNVLETYNSETSEWMDINNDINPDIIFFTNPHPSSTKEQYYIKNFLYSLTCYVPYTFQTTFHYQQNYDRFFHNALWKAYYQTTIHQKIAVKYARNKGANVVVTGYPGIDNFFASHILFPDKEKTQTKKNLIWAPHHTFEGEGMDLNFSTFLRYNNFMMELAKEYRDKLFIIFKPHPLLRPKLSKKENWGIERTNLYYKFWEENDFCAIQEGDYQKLFQESDAMMHDCDSFMGEYLALNKPVLYLFRDSNIKDRLNEFGKAAIDMHYKAGNEKDILNFINDVVINEKDEMKQIRSDWVKTIIVPPNSLTASMNIFVDLKRSLNIN